MASYDFEKRSTDFGVEVVRFCKKLPKDVVNSRLISQLVGSAGSVGANYREANDALGKNDFLHRLKIARKEAKEVMHWLELLEAANQKVALEINRLKTEANELKNILSSMIINTGKKL